MKSSKLWSENFFPVIIKKLILKNFSFFKTIIDKQRSLCYNYCIIRNKGDEIMGIDFIRNTRLDMKKKTLKFEIADGNIRPLTYYPVKIDDSEGKFQEELENFVHNIYSKQYHASGNSDRAIAVKYAGIKTDNLLSDYFEKGNYYDPENFITSFYDLKDEKSKEFFKEKAVPLFIECMTEKDRDGYAVTDGYGFIKKVTIAARGGFLSSWWRGSEPVNLSYKRAYVYSHLKDSFKIVSI